ncbi:MAG: radical SAM protein [Elusimicrobia bacterium]|nr:radical SAM protein [Elusimicrobiota bacterium]
MKILDCAVKPSREGWWLHHLKSSYKVRMNGEALATLKAMLHKDGNDGMSRQERLIHDKLSARGLVAPGAGGSGGLDVRDASLFSTLELELSGACNLSCGHCFAALSGRHMSSEVLERALEGAAALGAVTVVLNGGEPLLSPLFGRAVRASRAAGMRVVVMTNATLVDAGVAGLLGDAGVAKVVVSLDSFEEHHDGLRGAGAFAAAVAGIRLLVSGGLRVFVTSMVTRGSAAAAADFERFCRQDLGAAGVRFSAVMPIGRGASAGGRFGLPEEALKSLAKAGLLEDDSIRRPAGPVPAAGFDCAAGVEQCFVAADGLVFACHYFQNLREPLGDLARSSLAEIHKTGPEGCAVSRLDWGGLAACRACAAFSSCRGGCRARARLLAGSFDAPDPVACRIHR